MTLEALIKEFKIEVTDLTRKKATGNLTFKVNFTQGGIGTFEVDTHKKGTGVARNN
jgi:hypothetical protein